MNEEIVKLVLYVKLKPKRGLITVGKRKKKHKQIKKYAIKYLFINIFSVIVILIENNNKKN